MHASYSSECSGSVQISYKYVLLACMGGCVGGLLKFQSTSSVDNIPPKRNIGPISYSRKRQWSSSQDEMDNVGHSHSLETHPSHVSLVVDGETKPKQKAVFVNQGAKAWNEIRRTWVGNQSPKQRGQPREPVISWSTTYDDLLTTTQPFPEPIPLPEMVDFLVDTWYEEGLYD